MASLAGADPQGSAHSAIVIDALGAHFTRVAVFELEGTLAYVSLTRGVAIEALQARVSLVERTPLRSAIEAASPIIGSGHDPSGQALTRALGISPARAFVVIPLLDQGRIVALAYADREAEPISLQQTAELFSLCSKQLDSGSAPQPIRSSQVHRRARRLTLQPQAVRRSTGELPAVPPVLPFAPKKTEPTLEPPATPPSQTSPPVLLQTPKVDDRPDQTAPAAPPPLAARLPEPGAPPSVSAPSSAQRRVGGSKAASEGRPLALPPPPKNVVIRPTRNPQRNRLSFARPSRRGRLRPYLMLAASLMILSLLAAGFLLLAPPRTEDTTTFVSIPRGASVAYIADRLEESGVIRSAAAFKWIAQLSGRDRELKAGSYRIAQNRFSWQAIDELARGQVDLRTVTIPEGLSLVETADILETAQLTTRRAFLSAAQDPALLDSLQIPAPSAEGYLFPETYLIAKGLDAHDLVRVMVEQFHRVRRETHGPSAEDPEALHRWVTLASIVQREVKSSAEMRTVAGVFKNRLDQGMRLESCATVQYILGAPKARLTLEDVRIAHPYNTYLRPGLPPGPVASPGSEALAAAASPAEHDYLFFVARQDGTGKHVFSQTYEAHERARLASRH